MRTLLLSAVIAVCGLSGAVVAQAQGPVADLTGVIVKLPAGSKTCNSRATHEIRYAGVQLFSSTQNLANYEGQMVDVGGTLQLGWQCPTIKVDMVQPAARYFDMVAPFGVNSYQPVVFTATAPVGTLVAYFFGWGNGFLPLSSIVSPLGGKGTLLVQPIGLHFWAYDISIGKTVRLVRIPGYADLVGQTFRMQALTLGLQAPNIQFINRVDFKIGSGISR